MATYPIDSPPEQTMNALLPAWIIGAPFVALIADWMLAPKSTSFSGAHRPDQMPRPAVR
jgi:hypothetical protein